MSKGMLYVEPLLGNVVQVRNSVEYCTQYIAVARHGRSRHQAMQSVIKAISFSLSELRNGLQMSLIPAVWACGVSSMDSSDVSAEPSSTPMHLDYYWSRKSGLVESPL